MSAKPSSKKSMESFIVKTKAGKDRTLTIRCSSVLIDKVDGYLSSIGGERARSAFINKLMEDFFMSEGKSAA